MIKFCQVMDPSYIVYTIKNKAENNFCGVFKEDIQLCFWGQQDEACHQLSYPKYIFFFLNFM